MRDMEERGVDEERGVVEEESDVILVTEGECVCERERESVCVFSHSIDSFFTEFEKIKPRFEII